MRTASRTIVEHFSWNENENKNDKINGAKEKKFDGYDDKDTPTET